MNKRLTLSALGVILLLSLLSGCAAQTPGAPDNGIGNGWQAERSMKPQYAENFRVDYFNGGYTLITVLDSGRYLVVPEDCDAPPGLDPDITVLHRPVGNIYLAATSAMCLFDALDALDSISLSGTKAEGWYIDNARKAMESGGIIYAGKYSAPDYELILSEGCSLAVESTMIDHTPEVKEKLETLGIPVLTDRSSYEPHPLGRTEWIKLYAALLGKESAAERLFSEQEAYMNAAAGQENMEKTVAFFYISSSGYAVARKSGDYVTKMIELAGGKYIFEELGDSQSAAGTISLEMESFYKTAKEADFIIYNSAIDGEISSIADLIGKNSLMKDFKAVENGNVWCTSRNLFQETTQLGLMISDLRRMLTESGGGLTQLNFMYRLS